MNRHGCTLLKLCYFVLLHRSQGSHGLRSGHTRYCYLLAPNDVLNNPPHSLFHCVDCWWRYNSHAVMAEHQVSMQMYAGENSLFRWQLEKSYRICLMLARAVLGV